MKKLLTLATALLISLTCLFGLVSCDEGAGVPEGMQLVRGGDKYGYCFFAPEGWTVSSYGDFASAYLSTVTPVSVSFGEAEMPKEGKDGFTEEEIRAYFASRVKNIAFVSDSLKITTDGVKAPFGNETNAYKFDFTYEYPQKSGAIPYRTLQYIIVRNDRLYIFQYTAQNTAPKYAEDGMTYFELYISHEQNDNVVNAYEAISSFVFLDKAGEPPKAAGSQGELVLVSDPDLAGFELYAPKDSVEIASSALVQRDLGDGASVSMSRLVMDSLSSGDVDTDDYFDGIKQNLEKTFGKITMISEYGAVENEDGSYTYPNRLENELSGSEGGLFYEYEYSYGGVSYRTYTVISVVKSGLSYDYFVFTYSANTQSYDTALRDAMLTSVKFK